VRKALAYLSVVVLFFCACNKVPAPGTFPQASDQPIEFGVQGDASTKGQAAIVSKSALALTDFGVTAVYSAPGESFGAASINYIENYRFGYVTANVESESAFSHAWQGVSPHADTGPVTAKSVYWPLAGTLSFFSYAPYRADANADPAPVPDARDIALEAPVTDSGIRSRLPGYLVGSPLVRVTTAASPADQVDFLCAPPLLNRLRSSNGGQFTLDFSQHRMTQVKFGFNYSGVLADPNHHFVQVSSIEIRGVVNSKYLYFTKAGCVWSDAVSPADKTNPAAAFSTADYRIDTATGGLLSGPSGDVPARDGGNTNHLVLSTDAGTLFLLPQEIPADAELVITYYTGEQHGVPLTSDVLTIPLRTANLTAWPMGKQVRYLITLNIPNQHVSGMTAQVYDWESSGNSHTVQELLPKD